MAYNNIYPQFYQQYPQQQMQQQTNQLQMQSGGFMSVPTEQDARNYPVAPGNVMTFKIENQPIVCEKAQGFSQLEGPIFNKYRLVKEDASLPQTPEETFNAKDEIEQLKKDVKELKEKVYLKNKSIVRNTQPTENKGGYRREHE